MMRKPISYLTCSQEQFESVHEAVDKSRSKSVKVDKATMMALLIDHSRLIEHVERLNPA